MKFKYTGDSSSSMDEDKKDQDTSPNMAREETTNKRPRDDSEDNLPSTKRQKIESIDTAIKPIPGLQDAILDIQPCFIDCVEIKLALSNTNQAMEACWSEFITSIERAKQWLVSRGNILTINNSLIEDFIAYCNEYCNQKLAVIECKKKVETILNTKSWLCNASENLELIANKFYSKTNHQPFIQLDGNDLQITLPNGIHLYNQFLKKIFDENQVFLKDFQVTNRTILPVGSGPIVCTIQGQAKVEQFFNDLGLEHVTLIGSEMFLPSEFAESLKKLNSLEHQVDLDEHLLAEILYPLIESSSEGAQQSLKIINYLLLFLSDLKSTIIYKNLQTIYENIFFIVQEQPASVIQEPVQIEIPKPNYEQLSLEKLIETLIPALREISGFENLQCKIIESRPGNNKYFLEFIEIALDEPYDQSLKLYWSEFIYALNEKSEISCIVHPQTFSIEMNTNQIDKFLQFLKEYKEKNINRKVENANSTEFSSHNNLLVEYKKHTLNENIPNSYFDILSKITLMGINGNYEEALLVLEQILESDLDPIFKKNLMYLNKLLTEIKNTSQANQLPGGCQKPNTPELEKDFKNLDIILNFLKQIPEFKYVQFAHQFCPISGDLQISLRFKNPAVKQIVTSLQVFAKDIKVQVLDDGIQVQVIAFSIPKNSIQEFTSSCEKVKISWGTFLVNNLHQVFSFFTKPLESKISFALPLTEYDLPPVMKLVDSNNPLLALNVLEKTLNFLKNLKYPDILQATQESNLRNRDIATLTTLYWNIVKDFQKWDILHQKILPKIIQISQFNYVQSGVLLTTQALASLVPLFDCEKDWHNWATANLSQTDLDKIRKHNWIIQLQRTICSYANQHIPEIITVNSELQIIFKNVQPAELEVFSTLVNVLPRVDNSEVIFKIELENIYNFFVLMLDFDEMRALDLFELFFSADVDKDSFKKEESSSIVPPDDTEKKLLQQLLTKFNSKAAVSLKNIFEIHIEFFEVKPKNPSYEIITKFCSEHEFKIIPKKDGLIIRCTGMQQIGNLFHSLDLVSEQNSQFIGKFYASHVQKIQDFLVNELNDGNFEYLIPVQAMIEAEKFDEAMKILNYLKNNFAAEVNLNLIEELISKIPKQDSKNNEAHFSSHGFFSAHNSETVESSLDENQKSLS